MSGTNQSGLIILGNAGVGKSFLANILIGHDTFIHQFNATSVTNTTESVDVTIGSYTLTVFNIPGSIEAEQKRIDLNRREIDKAFAQRPNSIVMYVFGQRGGRIREEDVIAFNAINAAYPFRRESFLLVVNGLPRNRPSDYEQIMLKFLQQLLKGVDVNRNNLCLLDLIDKDNAVEKQHLKERLLRTVMEFTPLHDDKKQELETLIGQLKEEKKLIREQQGKFEADREKYMKQIEDSQCVLNEIIANHRREIESLKRAMQRQEECYTQQQRHFEEEKQMYQTQREDMRALMKQVLCHPK